jgi:hypothetical protein
MPTHALNKEGRLAAADGILDAAGGPITNWLASEALDFRDEDRQFHNRATESHLRAIGRLTDGRAWVASQTEAIIKIFGVTRYTRVAKLIAQRFMRARMDKLTAAAPTRAKIDPAIEDAMDYAPPHLVWVAKHRGLFGPEDCPLRKSAQAEYEKDNPAPGQEAINLFLMCRRDALSDKAECPNIKWLNSELNRFKLDQLKKKKESTVSEQDKEEHQRILDMRSELAKYKEKAG